MYKILIVEDEPIIAMHLSELVKEAGYLVAGVTYNGVDALDKMAAQRPDLVLLDIALDANYSGLDVAKIINQKYDLPFIFITSFSDQNTLNKVKKLRPTGFIVKPFKKKDVIVNIELALYEKYREHRSAFLSQNEFNSLYRVVISPREYDFMVDIAKGLSNQQLSDKYFVSLNTVKTHIKRIFNKLDLNSRSQIAYLLLRDKNS